MDRPQPMNDKQEAALDRLLDALDAATEVRELARAVAHRGFAAKLHESRSIKEVAASAVYVAFRRAGNAHSLDEIAVVTDLHRTALAQAYKRLTRELDIDLPPADPHEFVGRFAGSLDIDDRTKAMAHEIIDESVEAGLDSGVSPAGMAAGAEYLAAREHHSRLDQQEVADVAGVSTVTIRDRYSEQAKLLGMGRHGRIPSKRRSLFETD